jgi:hypothetical protein
MHGSLGRDNTFNNMAAIGPDFKHNYVDRDPVGNADIALTLAKILGFQLPASGHLKGRVLKEALAGGPHKLGSQLKVIASGQPSSGKKTVLIYQQLEHHRYFDEACLVELQASGSKENPCN